jgi:hypothetical protein
VPVLVLQFLHAALTLLQCSAGSFQGGLGHRGLQALPVGGGCSLRSRVRLHRRIQHLPRLHKQSSFHSRPRGPSRMALTLSQKAEYLNLECANGGSALPLFPRVCLRVSHRL